MIRVAARAGVRRVVPTRATSRAARVVARARRRVMALKRSIVRGRARTKRGFNAINGGAHGDGATPRHIAPRDDATRSPWTPRSTVRATSRAMREWTERADEATRTTDDDGMTDGRRRFQTDAQRSSRGCTRSKR